MTDTPQRGIRLAIVTNIPAPYRVPVYNRLAREPGIDLHAFYAARSEPDRQWDLPAFEHAHTFLAGKVHERAGRYIHFSTDVWPALRRFDPDVVLTTGYNPTHLLAFGFALSKRRRHVASTDGTDVSESHLSAVHRGVRRIVYAGSAAFVVVGQGGWRLLRSYRVPAQRIHFSPLCANTAVDWSVPADAVRDVDLLFSGRLVGVKNAPFALQVAQGLAARIGRRVRLAVLGSGPDEAAVRAQAAGMSADVDVEFAGHVAQAQVPGWFQRARLFLFPTRWDPWGVVANEACMAGVPVLVSPHAGVAGELIRDGVNGRVLPLDLPAWIDASAQILADAAVHARMAGAARRIVAQYSFENAALGIADAARQAALPGGPQGGPPARRSGFELPVDNAAGSRAAS